MRCIPAAQGFCPMMLLAGAFLVLFATASASNDLSGPSIAKRGSLMRSQSQLSVSSFSVDDKGRAEQTDQGSSWRSSTESEPKDQSVSAIRDTEGNAYSFSFATRLDPQSSVPVVIPPSTENYKLTDTNLGSYSQIGQDSLLLPWLHQIKNGFFVESGANDGETLSNTLLYELQYGWTGLLIEPTPSTFKALLAKHRHCYAFQGALSATPEPQLLHFSATEFSVLDHENASGTLTVDARPLLGLLQQVNRSTVDFWSLDIEGMEASVLEATDFQQIEVGVLLIEINKDKEGKVAKVMNKNGFKQIGMTCYRVDRHPENALDHIYINPEYFKKRQLIAPKEDELNSCLPL